jgi:hypothetical protein
MSYNMIIGYDIYDRFTMEHFPLRQCIILTTSFFARDSTLAKKHCPTFVTPRLYIIISLRTEQSRTSRPVQLYVISRSHINTIQLVRFK